MCRDHTWGFSFSAHRAAIPGAAGPQDVMAPALAPLASAACPEGYLLGLRCRPRSRRTLAAILVWVIYFTLSHGEAPLTPRLPPSDSSLAFHPAVHTLLKFNGLLLGIVGIIVVVLLVLVLLLQFLVNKEAVKLIEAYDRDYLGVDVNIGRVRLNVFFGTFSVHNLVVHNPAGFQTDYLLQVKKAYIDVNMLRLLRTLRSDCREIEITKFIMNDVDIIIEKMGVIGDNTNIKTVIDTLEGPEKKESTSGGGMFGSSSRKPPAPPPPAEGGAPKSKNKVVLKKVALIDIGAMLQVDTKLAGLSAGARVALADMKYDDFSEMGSQEPYDIIKTLLKSVMKTVEANLLGKEFADKLM